MKLQRLCFPDAAQTVPNAAVPRFVAPKARKGLTRIEKLGPHIRRVEGRAVFDLRVKEEADFYFRLMEARSRRRRLEIERREKAPYFVVIGGRVLRPSVTKDRQFIALWRAAHARRLLQHETHLSSRHQILKRLALSDDGSVDADARTISFVFSTSNVAADKHRILPGAWQSSGHDGLADFRANPVFLWAHDATQPAIGKVTSLTADKNGDLRGAVCFAAYPFADTVYQLYREGFQRGASVSFEPLDWNYATGPNRAPSALDFTRVKLWEISAVPLPADSSALAAARARGLFTEIDARGRRRKRARAHALRAKLICEQT